MLRKSSTSYGTTKKDFLELNRALHQEGDQIRDGRTEQVRIWKKMSAQIVDTQDRVG